MPNSMKSIPPISLNVIKIEETGFINLFYLLIYFIYQFILLINLFYLLIYFIY